MRKAFVENGIIKDIGPDMPIYPESMLVDVPSSARIGWNWDGENATPPEVPQPSNEPEPTPAEKLAAFLKSNPDVQELIS